MKKNMYSLLVFIFLVSFLSSSALGADLTLSTGGRVTIELISSEAAFHDTLSLASPGAVIVVSGCDIENVTDASFTGLGLLSEKISQHGCRVDLDADPATAGIQPFTAGTVLSFNLCAQDDADFSTCEYIWSSNPASNSDGDDHVRTTTLHGGNYNLMAWEDKPDLGDEDFNDLVAVVRIVQDTDGDGLWDDWEQSGIDTNGDGAVDFILPGANFQHKDIYIEIDYMDCATAGGDCAAGDTHTHRPKAAAIAAVEQAFRNAPVPNPDGFAGIEPHIDIDDALPHQNTFGIGCFSEPSPTDFDNIKNDATYFGPDNPRRYAYHYVIFAHQQTATTTSSGCGEYPGNDFMVSLGHWNYSCVGGIDAGRCCPAALNPSWCSNCPGSTCSGEGDVDGDGSDDHDVGTINQQAGTLMHELGHNLNLHHGGDECWNYKPNYLSIMNYWFQTRGIPPDPDGAGVLTGRIDYSGIDLPDLDERSVGGVGQLNETIGIQDGTDDTRYFCPAAVGGNRTGAGTGAIDWNCDNDGGTDTTVSVNLNGDCVDTAGGWTCECDAGETGRLSVLTGYNDWLNLKYDFQNTENFQDGVHMFPENFNMADVEFPIHQLVINAPPIANAGPDQMIECTGPDGALVTFNGSASRDPDGDPLTYTWVSPFEAKTGVEVQMQLPMGTNCVTLTVDDGRGGTSGDTACATVRDTTPPYISAPADVTTECVSPDGASPDIGTPVVSDICDPSPTIVNNAPSVFPIGSTIVTWTATDASSNSNTDTQNVSIVDTTPPTLTFEVIPTTLWPPNHKMEEINPTVTVSDICDPDPEVTLVSITSSEHDNGLGDGDKPNDIQINDDYSYMLRSERSGIGQGRVYTIIYEATDDAGNVTSENAEVIVPHDKR